MSERIRAGLEFLTLKTKQNFGCTTRFIVPQWTLTKQSINKLCSRALLMITCFSKFWIPYCFFFNWLFSFLVWFWALFPNFSASRPRLTPCWILGCAHYLALQGGIFHRHRENVLLDFKNKQNNVLYPWSIMSFPVNMAKYFIYYKI